MAEPGKQGDVDDSESELEGGRMPFLSHLAELRDRVRNAAIAFVIAVMGCFYASDYIFEWLKEPLFDVWSSRNRAASSPVQAYACATPAGICTHVPAAALRSRPSSVTVSSPSRT